MPQRCGFYRWLLLSWVFCLLSGLMPPSELRAQTLEEALVSTYLTNPTLKVERATLRAATEVVAEAKGGWRPTFAIESAIQANSVDEGGIRDNYTSSAAALVLEQNIFQGGETVASVAQAEHLLMYRRARLQVTEQEVLQTAIEAYAGLQSDLSVLELAAANQQRLALQLDGTKRRFKAGELTGTDVAQAEARYAGSIAEHDRSKSAVRASRALYQSIAGQEAGSLSTPDAPLPMASSEAEAQRLAIDGNPAVSAARYRLAAAEADIRITKATLYPRLDLQAEVGYADRASVDTGSERNAAIGVELRVPLYQGGGEYARIRRARQEANQFENTLEAVKLAVKADTSRAWQDFRAARSTIGSITGQVQAAERALAGAKKEAEVGQRTILDVLDLESDLFDASVDLANARRDELVAGYKLSQALGELSAEALDLPAKRFDPQRYDLENRNRLIGIGG